MIHAIIFDYFGVVRPTGVRTAYRILGGDIDKDEAFITDVTTAGDKGFIDDADLQLANRLGVSLETWRLAVYNSQANDEELLAYIKELRKRGYKIGLLSNARAGMFDMIFSSDADQYFDSVMASGDYNMTKPEPAFYRLMAEKLQVEASACVMIDDRDEFCEGAVRVGMQGIVYKHFAQCKRELEALLANSKS